LKPLEVVDKAFELKRSYPQIFHTSFLFHKLFMHQKARSGTCTINLHFVNKKINYFVEVNLDAKEVIAGTITIPKYCLGKVAFEGELMVGV
jgi:hypothetical protein